MTVEQLGNEITTMAAHMHAAMCRWLLLVAEFDRRGGWGEDGCKSCAHWISWKCSVSPGPAREHVRVARRLEGLPLTCEAFGRGELSYSKVRALTRVEDVEDEAALVDLARHSTAAQLERTVRAYRGVVRAEDAERAHDERFVSLYPDHDGSWVLRGRLTAEDGAVLARALDAARDELRTRKNVPAGTPAAPDDESQKLADPASARGADALVLLADTLLANGPADRSSSDRYQVVVHVDAAALAGSGDGHEACELEGGGPVAPATAQRIACDASLVTMVEKDGKPLTVGRKTRSVPPAMRRALRRRDECCRFPGCTQHRGLDAHHIHHWAHGGDTALDNLVHLCRYHHRLLHEGRFSLQRDARGGLVFTGPRGPLSPTGGPPRRGDCGAIRRGGPEVTPTTCVPVWWGDRLDLGMAVDAVLDAAPLSGGP